MIVPNIGGGQSGAVRHIQRGFSSSATIALSGFKNLDKMFVEIESGTYSLPTGSSDTTESAHISKFSLTSMTLSTHHNTIVMYQVIEFS